MKQHPIILCPFSFIHLGNAGGFQGLLRAWLVGFRFYLLPVTWLFFFYKTTGNTCLSECVRYGVHWSLFLVAWDMLQTYLKRQKAKEQKKVWRNDEVPLNLLSKIWAFASLQLEHSFGHPVMWWDWVMHAFSQLGVQGKRHAKEWEYSLPFVKLLISHFDRKLNQYTCFCRAGQRFVFKKSRKRKQIKVLSHVQLPRKTQDEKKKGGGSFAYSGLVQFHLVCL